MFSKGILSQIARVRSMSHQAYYGDNNPNLGTKVSVHDWQKVELSYKVVFDCKKCGCKKEEFDKDPTRFKCSE